LPELFAALRARGKLLGILSDYPAHQKLERLDLAGDHIAWAGEPDIGILKPNPRGLEHLMRLAQVRPEQTVMIGDRVERDGLAAQRAGTHVLIRSDRPIPGWTTFKRFDDLIFAPLLNG
jgi:putative hydrolase of the HAD superfamily